MLNPFVAHAGEAHAEESVGALGSILHQPTWVGLLLVAIVGVLLFQGTKLLKWSLPARLLVTVASLIGIGVLYLPHNPSVTGISLSIGFIVTFLLTFTMLGKPSE